MKSVLMIAYYFPPDGSAGVYRPLRFVRHLAARGWQPSCCHRERERLCEVRPAVDGAGPQRRQDRASVRRRYLAGDPGRKSKAAGKTDGRLGRGCGDVTAGTTPAGSILPSQSGPHGRGVVLLPRPGSTLDRTGYAGNGDDVPGEATRGPDGDRRALVVVSRGSRGRSSVRACPTCSIFAIRGP